MAAFNIQEALIWKEKVESVIDQYQESLVANGIKYVSFEYKSGIDNGRKSSSSDHDSQFLFMVYSVPLKKVAYDQGGGFNISPLKPQNGRPRTQVQHLMQIDLKGWGVGYISSFQQHCLLQMLNNVAGISEYFSQTNERSAHPRIPVMVNMASTPVFKEESKAPQP
ncbi:hypothetical protein CsSME_00049597 [Camellia sinensis var. sinensis]